MKKDVATSTLYKSVISLNVPSFLYGEVLITLVLNESIVKVSVLIWINLEDTQLNSPSYF